MYKKIILSSKSKQKTSIKTSILILKNSKNKNYSKYVYNNILYFEYFIHLDKSILNIEINVVKNINLFNSLYIGSFIYEQIKNFCSNIIEIKSIYTDILDKVFFEFKNKSFIFDKYLTNQNSIKYLSSYKLTKKRQLLLDAINFQKMLVSEPSNIIYPDSFAKLAVKQINKKNVLTKVLNENQIKKNDLRCLLAVNQGSNKSPRVVEFKKISKTKEVDVLFVGKGVCFDSGGISIKPAAGMEDMKWDMGGAAIVAALMFYLSNLKTNFSYAGIIGLVENMPSGSAYKPGDIIKSHKGINVEVINTDAEGRLVLADIISYGCDVYKPKIIIDFATLTGAIMVALGQHFAGLFTNDDEIAKNLLESGINTNEKVWRMPLHDDFDKELNSPFVDLKNISNGRYGGSVTAAQFLKRFIPENTKWAHLDIAGVTWKSNGDKINNKGATGFGLTLIADFIDKYF